MSWWDDLKAKASFVGQGIMDSATNTASAAVGVVTSGADQLYQGVTNAASQTAVSVASAATALAHEYGITSSNKTPEQMTPEERTAEIQRLQRQNELIERVDKGLARQENNLAAANGFFEAPAIDNLRNQGTSQTTVFGTAVFTRQEEMSVRGEEAPGAPKGDGSTPPRVYKSAPKSNSDLASSKSSNDQNVQNISTSTSTTAATEPSPTTPAANQPDDFTKAIGALFENLKTFLSALVSQFQNPAKTPSTGGMVPTPTTTPTSGPNVDQTTQSASITSFIQGFMAATRIFSKSLPDAFTETPLPIAKTEPTISTQPAPFRPAIGGIKTVVTAYDTVDGGPVVTTGLKHPYNTHLKAPEAQVAHQEPIPLIP